MGNVTQTFSGDVTQLQRCYQSLVKEVTRLEVANQKLAATSQAASDGMSRGLSRSDAAMGGMVSKVATLAGSFLTLQGVVRLGTQEMERQFAVQDRIKAKQIDIAKTHWDAAGSQANVTPEEFQKRTNEALEIQKHSGFPEAAKIQEGINRAMNATQGNWEIAREASKMAARVSLAKPEDMPILAEGLATGMHLKGIGAEAALGNLGLQQGESRSQNLSTIAGIQGRIASAADTHAKANQLDEVTYYEKLNATISNKTQDADGPRTASAGVNLGQKLAEFFDPSFKGAEDSTAPKLPGSHRPHKKVKPVDPEKYESTESQVEYLQQNPKIAKVFYNDFLHGEKESRPALKSLLLKDDIEELRKQGKQSTSDMMKKSQIESGTGAIATGKNLENLLRSGTPELEAASRDSQRKNKIEVSGIHDVSKAKRAEARELVDGMRANLDSAGWFGGAALSAQSSVSNLLGQGSSAQAFRGMVDSAAAATTSDKDKETITDTRKQLEAILGPSPKNRHLQARGVSKLNSSEELRGMQRELLTDDARAKGRLGSHGPSSRGDLRPYERDAFEELESRIKEQQIEERRPMMGYEAFEANAGAAGRQERIEKLKGERDQHSKRTSGGQGLRRQLEHRERGEAIERDLSKELRADYVTKASTLDSDDLFFEHQKAAKAGPEAEQFRQALPAFGNNDPSKPKDDANQKEMTSLLRQILEALRNSSGGGRPQGVSAGRANMQSGIQSER